LLINIVHCPQSLIRLLTIFLKLELDPSTNTYSVFEAIIVRFMRGYIFSRVAYVDMCRNSSFDWCKRQNLALHHILSLWSVDLNVERTEDYRYYQSGFLMGPNCQRQASEQVSKPLLGILLDQVYHALVLYQSLDFIFLNNDADDLLLA